MSESDWPEYDDVTYLKRHGYWPYRYAPNWARKLSAKMGTHSSENSVLLEGLLQLIERKIDG